MTENGDNSPPARGERLALISTILSLTKTVIALKDEVSELRQALVDSASGNQGEALSAVLKISEQNTSSLAALEEIAGGTKKTLGRIDVRLIRIEDRQNTDFRLLFGAIIAVALALAALMAKGFHWL
jgi:hypothetical protein